MRGLLLQKFPSWSMNPLGIEGVWFFPPLGIEGCVLVVEHEPCADVKAMSVDGHVRRRRPHDRGGGAGVAESFFDGGLYRFNVEDGCVEKLLNMGDWAKCIFHNEREMFVSKKFLPCMKDMIPSVACVSK